MADDQKYFIRLHGKEIEVSEDVYYAYFQVARQERTQDEKLQRNHVVSYDAMDNEGMVGAEAFEDLEAPSMEELIRAIYFEGMTEKEYAKWTGMSQTGISYRRRSILSKLKLSWILWEVFANFCYAGTAIRISSEWNFSGTRKQPSYAPCKVNIQKLKYIRWCAL